jgi:putative cell wall-binding protein
MTIISKVTCSIVSLALAVSMLAGTTTVESASVFGLTSVERVAGSDRYVTSVDVATLVGGGSLTGLDRLIVVSGESFPDGLAASGLAGFLDDGGRSGRTAILLTRTSSLPGPVRDAIRDSKVPASQILVVGGVAAVSDSVRAVIAAAAGWDGAGANPVTRIAGQDRYGTAAAIVDYVTSAAGGSLPASYRTVLTASGEQFPDALAAGALAYRNGHLLLLSRQLAAPQATLDAVTGLDANCALLIGGAAAIATGVANRIGGALRSTGGCGVERLAGRDRYETATKVADRFVAINGIGQPTLASGIGFADSLTAAPLAGGNRPLLLTAPNQLSGPTAAWLEDNRADIDGVLIIGGTNAISATVGEQSSEILQPPPTAPGSPPPVSGSPPPATTVPVPSTSTWANQAGGPHFDDGNDAGVGVSVLSDGSAIITGYFHETATFGATTLISAGNSDVFVAKVSPTGAWVWTSQAGGPHYDTASGISVLGDGSAIITGSFKETATFGTTTLTSTATQNDGFVAKMDANGNWVWATAIVGTNSSSGFGVAVLSDGSAIITGDFKDTATFGTTTLTSTGIVDVFIAKISPNGAWLWATHADGSGSTRGDAISVLSDGSAIITGRFSGTSTFGATILTSTGTQNDGFVAKIDANGNWMWATAIVGTNSSVGLGVSVLSDDSAIITGVFTETATFGATTLTSTGSGNAFVAKISAAGAWVWANQAGGTGFDIGQGVSVLSDGSAIVTGSFEGDATFGATTLTSNGNIDVFVAKVSPTGTWLWANQLGGTPFNEGNGVAVLSDGSAIITGYFFGTTTIGVTTLTSTGNGDVFVAKIDANGSFG